MNLINKVLSCNKFDSDEVQAREEKKYKNLFRGVSKDNLHKAIVFV